jgi:hypothetical protein
MWAFFIVRVVWRRLAIRSVAVWASRLVYGSRFGRIAEGELLGPLIVHDNGGSMAPATGLVKSVACEAHVVNIQNNLSRFCWQVRYERHAPLAFAIIHGCWADVPLHHLHFPLCL